MVEATLAFIKILNIKKTPSVGILVFSVQMGVCLFRGHFKDVTLIQFPYKSLFLGWTVSWFFLSVPKTHLCWSLLSFWITVWELKEIGYSDFNINNELSKSSEMPCYVSIHMSQYARYCYRYYFTWGSQQFWYRQDGQCYPHLISEREC